MTLEPHLQRLRDGLTPDMELKDRVRARMMKRIDAPAVLLRARQEATPSAEAQEQLWLRVLRRIDVPDASQFLHRIRAFFSPLPTQQQLVRVQIMARLVPKRAPVSYRWTKWTAAAVLVVVALRASPVLFLAPSTVAQSKVIVLPTRGDVTLSLHELWQPVTGDVTLNEPVQLRTGDGEATILLHDDGTIRLAPHTVVSLHDLSDRPEPSLGGSTLTLTQGRVWLQGLLPAHLRGIVVSTPYGDVVAHDGSVSVAVDRELLVRVWDRHVVVTQEDTDTVLVAGERARFGEDTVGNVTRIGEDEYRDPWVRQNLERDAVHQREIAQMQRERRAAEAGILPTSPFYPVKRVVEKVDVLLTIDPQQKVQKQLEQASTRLNEAAGLIAEGSEGAEIPLQEYTHALLAVAGTGGSSVAQFLLRQEVAENTADVSAAKPSDDMYLIKKAVLEASAQLQVDVDKSDVEGILLVDTLDALHEAIEQGDTQRAQETYDALQPHLSSLEEDALKPEVKKEVLQLLSDATEKLQAADKNADVVAGLETALKPLLPQKPEPPVYVPLTDAQIDAMVERIMQRVNVYDQQRSRKNQVLVEVAKLKGHPDEGRILRRFYHALPPENLGLYVRRAIQELREETNQ